MWNLHFIPELRLSVHLHLETLSSTLLGTADLAGLPSVADLEKFSYKKKAISQYVEAYRNYCWEINSVDDYKLAPFHILATEGVVHVDKNHEWHMENIKEICQADEKIFQATSYKIVDTDDRDSIQAAIDWWLDLT